MKITEDTDIRDEGAGKRRFRVHLDCAMDFWNSRSFIPKIGDKAPIGSDIVTDLLVREVNGETLQVNIQYGPALGSLVS